MDVARGYLSLELRLDPTRRPRALMERGWAAWLEGDCEGAQRAWEQACAEGPPDRVAVSCLQLYLRSEGELGRVPRAGLGAEWMAGYAHDFGRRAERAEAEAQTEFCYALSLELAPSREAATRLTRLLRRAERGEEAVAVWDGLAAALPPEDPDRWWALGEAAGLRRDWELSAWAYGQGGERAEEPYRFWRARGRALQRLQDWEGAQRAYQRALWARPGYYLPYLYLGQVHLRQERDLRAWRWFGAALAMRSDHASSNYHMAQVLHKTGAEHVAVSFLARAVELHPREPWRWAVRLGDWRLALGDREGALAAYRRALEWRPAEDSIEERIEQVEGGNAP